MENFEKSPSIFAVMVPANNAARASFSQVAQKMLEDKDWNPTARQNIQANADSIQVSHDSSVSESDGGNATPKTSSPVSVGCYTFDFVKPPEEPGNGWLIGGGKFSESDLRPEILLTERRKHDRVSSRHARLSHNFKSGALLISASENSAVLVDGYRLINGHRVIHGITTSLEFGELSYTLEIRKYEADEDFRNHLRIYKQQNNIAVADYPQILLATPAESDFINENYVLKNPVGNGATSVVYAAFDRRNGDAVAIKKIRRTNDNAPHIQQDLIIADHIGKHPRICHLVDMITPDPSRGFQVFGVDEVLLIYTPLASWTIEKLINSRRALDVRIQEKLFWQVLEGIEFLHSKEIMHRDIKPLNIAVVSIDTDNPQARLIDFGWATFGLESDAYSAGTVTYRAPEMCAGLDSRTTHRYTEKVDIFAFGLTMYQFFCHQPRHWDRIDHDANKKVNACNLLQIRDIISDPQNRPSATMMLEARSEWPLLTKNAHTGPSGSVRDDNEVEDNEDEIGTSMRSLDIHESGQEIFREPPDMSAFDPSKFHSTPIRGLERWRNRTKYESSPFTQ